VRSRRDSGVTVTPRKAAAKSWRDDPILSVKAAGIRRAERDRNVTDLRRIQRRAKQWEPWQGGLIAAAAIFVEKIAPRDDRQAEMRAAATRERDRLSAQARRGTRAQVPAKRAAGRPASASETFFVRVGVQAHVVHDVPYLRVAEFIVNTVAKLYIPRQYRSRVVGPSELSPAQQKVRLAQRMRQWQSRNSRIKE
jgi:hypothetical protein